MTTVAVAPSPRLAPGPPPHAFLSTLRALGRDPLAFFLDAQRRYGDVVRIPLAHRSFVVVSHAEGMRHVLVDNARNYDKRTASFAKLRAVVGEGLLTADDDGWLERRRVAQPAFAKDRLAALLPIVARETTAMLDRWRRQDLGKPIDAGREMARLTIAIAVASLIGEELGEDAATLASAAEHVIAHVGTRIEAWVDVPEWVPTPANEAFRAARDVLDAVVARVLERPRAGDAELLRRLRAAGSTRDSLRDDLMTMLVAGHETTANVLTWTLDAISRAPHVVRKLRNEHAALATPDGATTPSVTQVDQLVFTSAVLREVMRLRPPAWLIERRAKDDDVIDGHAVPRGMVVALVPYVLHRRDDVWERPDEFVPERFLPEGAARISRFGYLPFGAGPRQCIGGRFAMIEAALIVASIVRAFDLEATTPAPPLPRPGVTLRPRTAVELRVHRV
jgi:cytochrome P450